MDTTIRDSLFIQSDRIRNTYKHLETEQPRPGQEWTLLVYFLNDKIGSDGYHGKWMTLGCFPSKREAENKAEEIIRLTGHENLFVAPTCTWQDLTTKISVDRTTYVQFELEKELNRQQIKDEIARREADEKNRKIRAEISEEYESEKDPDSLASYIKSWYDITRQVAAIERQKKLIEDLAKMTNKMEDLKKNLEEKKNRHPEYEKIWIKEILGQFQSRGEYEDASSFLSNLKKYCDNEKIDIKSFIE